MTTILKAAQELDREGGLVTPPMAPTEPTRKPQLLRIAVLVLAVAAAGLSLALLLVLSGRQAPPAPGVPERAMRDAAPATPAGVGPTVPAAAVAPPPRIEKSAPAAPAAVTRPAAAPQERGNKERHARTPRQAPEARSKATGGAAPPQSVEEDEPKGGGEEGEAAEEGRSAGHAPLPRSAAPLDRPSTVVGVPGEPEVQVKSLSYSADVRERSVALELAGGRGVSLHEGESSGGVEVQLILPNAVYLRKGGSIIAVSVPTHGR